MSQLAEPAQRVRSVGEPWRLEAANVAEDLATDVAVGLTSAEAAVRLDAFGPNVLDASEVVSSWRKFAAQFADPLIYLLLGAVAVSFTAWLLEGREVFRSRFS